MFSEYPTIYITLNIMSKVVAYITVVLIVALNSFVVFFLSVLGVYGDGSVGVMPLVQGFGGAWVGAFAVAALVIVARGNEKRGVGVAAKTLPYALLLLLLGLFISAMYRFART